MMKSTINESVPRVVLESDAAISLPRLPAASPVFVSSTSR
jgi:hypothetical protein